MPSGMGGGRMPWTYYLKRYSPFVIIGSAVIIAVYPIIIDPAKDSSQWAEIQKQGRAGIKQDEIQPGGMRVWSSPFQPREDQKKS